MFTLLKPEDKNVLRNSNFVKNAIFYKDMICFHYAYSCILENKERLPNFCFLKDDELCLEGICLLMKMYATEFKFETLKLSLDYLKILYFAIACYAENDSVDSQIIIEEFEQYRLASETYCDEQKQKVMTESQKIKKTEKSIQNKSKKIISMENWAKCLKISAWILLALSVIGIIAPIMIYIRNTASVFVWLSIAGVLFGFIITIACFVISKKLLNHVVDLTFHVQNAKKELNAKVEEFAAVQSQFYRVFCEKYEYSMCFSELFSKFADILTIDEILNKASEYKLLSYNVRYDINRLFKSQQKEIDAMILSIEEISNSENFNLEFENLYLKIKSQDWMFYNQEIRYHFLKKFTDIAEREHCWKLEVAGNKINPFDVNVKALSREKIAFSENEDMKLISANLNDFIKTSYFKNFEDLNFKAGYSADLFKKVKSNYLMHFYNADILEYEKTMLYDSKANKKLSGQKTPLSVISKIPTLVGMKLKLIEKSMGLGNSDAKVIKTIASSIFTDIIEDKIESLNLKEEDIDYPKFTASKVEKFDDRVEYIVNGKKIVGYKTN